MKSHKIILAIETSCDETGIAILKKENQIIKVLAEKISSQIDIHKETGGIVPEVAAREHVAVIQSLVKQVFKESQVDLKEIDAIAVTVGPGLMPALSIGVTTAQTLGYALNKLIIPVHHLEGHIYAALLSADNKALISNFQFPISKHFPVLALIVSGGHTMLVKMDDHLQYQVLGSTRDDAAGEAFDKVARLLGLSYPGGPAISEKAKSGDPKAFGFTRPMLQSGDLDFSFSGLKTEVFYTVRDLKGVRYSDDKGPDTLTSLSAKTISNLSASFQQTAVDTLIAKTKKAIDQVQPKLLLLTGGVAANQLLRKDFQALADQNQLPFKIAPLKLCGDNATMIGLAGMFAYESGRTKEWSDIDAQARINLEEYSAGQLAA